jgi:hypothetical protein
VIRAIVLAAAKKTKASSIRQWLIADEHGAFERRAGELLEMVPLCYQREVVVNQIACVLVLEALEAAINNRPISARP